MIKKVRNILISLLIISMCIPMSALAEMNETIHAEQEDSQGLEEPGTEDQMISGASEDEDQTVVQENPDVPEISEPEPPVQNWKIGWNYVDGEWYYCKEANTLYYGWIQLRSKWYYLDKDNEGIMVRDTVKNIGGCNYAFDASGAMLTGWVLRPEGWYYAKSNGVFALGWIKLKNLWYYLDGTNEEHPGIMVEDCVFQVGNQYYSFKKNGTMNGAGWVQRAEGWYYANSNGSLVVGWKKLKNIWYYLDGNNMKYPGLMVSDCSMEIGGHTYIFKASGAMHEGWYLDGEAWYYYDASGLVASGWRAIKGYWYYLDPNNDNKLVSDGWESINNKWYHFRASGAMSTNWLSLDGEWYWLAGDGAMKTGWQFAGSAWYYMYTKDDSHGGQEGVMAKNTVIDGYVLHENGAYHRSRNKMGWQNPAGYPQVSSLSVLLPSYCKGYFTYVTPSRISINATRQECVEAFIARAYEYLGTKYIEPWSSYPGDAVDCSGLVLQCLYATGMDLGVYNPYNHRWLPMQTYNSMNWYRNHTFMPVNVNSIQRGDLIYYSGHVAIYLGNGQIIDSWPRQGVSIKPIGSRGRVIGAARPFV